MLRHPRRAVRGLPPAVHRPGSDRAARSRPRAGACSRSRATSSSRSRPGRRPTDPVGPRARSLARRDRVAADSLLDPQRERQAALPLRSRPRPAAFFTSASSSSSPSSASSSSPTVHARACVASVRARNSLRMPIARAAAGSGVPRVTRSASSSSSRMRRCSTTRITGSGVTSRRRSSSVAASRALREPDRVEHRPRRARDRLGDELADDLLRHGRPGTVESQLLELA